MSLEIARRYAKALLSLTKQKSAHRRALEELLQIKQALSGGDEVQGYFSNPLIPPDQKILCVKTAFTGRNLLEEVSSLMVLLAEKNRFSIFSDVVDALQEAIDLEEGVTRGVIRTAKPMTEAQKKELEEKIGRTLNKKIVLTVKEDPRLLAGVITEVGGWTFDDSIESHLKKLNEELNRSAN